MYAVSNKYNTMLSSGYIKNNVIGIITLSDSSTISISDSNIIAGSLNINNKCSSGSLCFGSVYVGAMSVTLIGLTDEQKVALKDANITLSYKVTYIDNTTETIPLGVWTISEAKINKRSVAITCYDAMTKFDKDYNRGYALRPYRLIASICDDCGVTLATAETFFDNLPNKTVGLTATSEDIQTYRDLLSYVCKVVGAFATINRSGQLEIRSLLTTGTASTISTNLRTSLDIASSATWVKKVVCNIMYNEEGYKISTAGSGDKMDLGDIPLKVSVAVAGISGNLLSALNSVRPYEFKADIIPNVAYDLGDDVSFSVGDSAKTSKITSIDWTYRQSMMIGCDGVGKNTSSTSVSKKAKAESTKKTTESASGAGGRIISVERVSSTAYDITAQAGTVQATNRWTVADTESGTTWTNSSTGETVDFDGFECGELEIDDHELTVPSIRVEGDTLYITSTTVTLTHTVDERHD